MAARPRSLILLLVVAVLGLGACGGGGSAADKSVDQLLKETFGSGKGIQSGNVNASLTFRLAGISGFDRPVAIKLSGPFEGQGKGKMPKFDLALSFRQAGQSLAAGAVSTGTKGYLRFGGRTFAIDGEVFEQFRQAYLRARKQSSDKEDTTLKALGIDPRRWLTGARKAGEVDVAGARTVHITAGIAVDRFLEDMNRLLARAGDLGIPGAQNARGLTATQRREIARATRTARVDVYTGMDDTILRRLVLNLDLTVPEQARKSVGGLRDGKIALDLRFEDLNEPQKIKTPANARPFSELAAGAGGLLGGGGGGQASGAETPPADVSESYLRCVQSAGGDVSKAQKCAELLR